MTFAQRLKKLGACDEAVQWVGTRTRAQAIRDCKRPEWMFWFLTRTCGERGSKAHCLVVRLAADCAALQYVPKGEDRPRLAIEAARAYAANPTPENRERCRNAYAAYTAAYAAAYAYDAAAYAAAAYAADDAAALAEEAAAHE